MSVKTKNFHKQSIPMVEIFQSISGEGASTGNIVSFVRVAGCDLRCTWCDTKYSFKTEGEEVLKMLPNEILSEIGQLGNKEIICTGGEPLEPGLNKRLIPAFLQSKGYKVRIETSGGSPLYSTGELAIFDLDSSIRPVYTMDVKCPASRMEKHNRFENFRLLDNRDELKFVVADEVDLDYSLSVIEEYRELLSQNEVLLNFSPVFEALEPKALVDWILERNSWFEKNKLKVRLSLQTHKYIWAPHQRGV
jgi:7-carboxy-7-deazaguanine synthase